MTLEGRKAISEFLGCRPRRLVTLARAGAPIRIVGDGNGARYLALADELRDWLARRARALPGLDLVKLDAWLASLPATSGHRRTSR